MFCWHEAVTVHSCDQCYICDSLPSGQTPAMLKLRRTIIKRTTKHKVKLKWKERKRFRISFNCRKKKRKKEKTFHFHPGMTEPVYIQSSEPEMSPSKNRTFLCIGTCALLTSNREMVCEHIHWWWLPSQSSPTSTHVGGKYGQTQRKPGVYQSFVLFLYMDW